MTAPSMATTTAIPKMAEPEEASKNREIGVEELIIIAACAGVFAGVILINE